MGGVKDTVEASPLETQVKNEPEFSEQSVEGTAAVERPNKMGKTALDKVKLNYEELPSKAPTWPWSKK